ncbi:MAG: Dam family site-specific DNA-(adenine-N6)-methyltransferase [Cyclobacteriaceae bacterium]
MINNIKEDIQNCKPFLRWAGGKSWFLKHLNDFLPKEGFNNYHEPFVGGGSIFFYLKPRNAFLSDLNKELVSTYQIVKNDVEGVISELKKFENTEEFYYQIRKSKFKKETKKAAQFIYLNQTSFNGIYRVNLNGEYNVPYGFRKKNFYEPENLRKVSKSLESAEISYSDFMSVAKNIKKGDLVFLDPPYTVTHNNNGFIKYNQKLFSIEDQMRLSQLIDHIRSKQAYYILTNAAHADIKLIFDKSERIEELGRASLIGGRKAKRGTFNEFIFTNVIKN